jgi:hypothetical protein
MRQFFHAKTLTMTGEYFMTQRLLISTLQDLCWAIEPLSQQLPRLIHATHPYQPLLGLLERNIIDVCVLLENNTSSMDFTAVKLRIEELIHLIRLMRDYAFDDIADETVDSHLTQIKEGLEHIIGLMIQPLLKQNQMIVI